MNASMPSSDIKLFIEVARPIAGENVPPWFTEHLRRWAPSLFLDRHVEQRQPTRAEVRRRLAKIRAHAMFLLDEISVTPLPEFLQAASVGLIENFGLMTRALQDLASCARQAANSAALANEAGITKAGRGKAMPPGAFSPRLYCAILIAEAWRHFHGRYPTLGNRKAAEAGDKLWRAAGGERNGWGIEPLNAWRYHFARAQATDASELRDKYRRHLRAAAIGAISFS